ncbi:MAG: hypothetical protein QM778_16090 [Myxococcales bacterium]
MSSRIQTASISSGLAAQGGGGSPKLQRIEQVQDRLIRNGLVTLGYHDLSKRLRAALRREDANWATFATWTSRAAGNFIRGDRIPVLVHSILQSSQRNEGGQALAPLGKVAALPALPKRKVGLLSGRVLETVSDVFAEANWEIYRELSPVLDAFAVWLGGLARPDDAALLRFCGRLDGSPSRLGGQDLLARALRCYHAARFERERQRSAQLVLEGNILIAWHEQFRLRPKLTILLDAPVADVLHVTELVAGTRLRESWRYLVTRTMLTSYVPEARRLPVGPRTQKCVAQCPLPLDALESEFDPLDTAMATTLAQARELSQTYADLRERMRHTAQWYWENQHTEALFRPPFVGRRNARLIAFLEEEAPDLAPHARAHRARAGLGAKLGQRYLSLGVSPSDPMLEAALAMSSPRVANSVTQRDRRAG